MTEPITVNYCANHPNVETNLRCSRCDKLICPKCMVHTPTGYKCRECVRGQQKVFETTVWYDLILGPVIAVILAFGGSLIVPRMGFFTIFLSPLMGGLIAAAVRFAVRRRRSRTLFLLTAAGAVLGALPVLLISILSLVGAAFSAQMPVSYGVWGLVWDGVYIALVTSTLYYRLSGLQLGR